MFNKIAILGLLLIILVLIIVFLIIKIYGPVKDKYSSAQLKDKYSSAQLKDKYSSAQLKDKYSGGTQLKDKYSGGAQLKDKYENYLVKLKELISGDIKSIMLYYDNNDNMGGRDNTIANRQNSFRILFFENNRYVTVVDHTNSVYRLTNYNNAVLGLGVDANTAAANATPNLFNSENLNAADYINTINLSNYQNSYLFNYQLLGPFLPNTPIWEKQIGTINYFNNINNKITEVIQIFNNMANQYCSEYLKKDNYVDYLFNGIKGIINNNAADIVMAINNTHQTVAVPTGNDDPIIDENQLSADMINLISKPRSDVRLGPIILNILNAIIRLMDYSYNKENDTNIKIYINILCEILRAEKYLQQEGPDNINFMIDLYNLFLGDANQIFIDSVNNGNANPNNNKIIDIIIKLLKNYKFYKTFTKNMIKKQIFGIQNNGGGHANDTTSSSNTGLRFSSLYQTTVVKDINNPPIKTIHVLNHTTYNTPGVYPLVIENPAGLINVAINPQINGNTIYENITNLILPNNIKYINALLKVDLHEFKKNNTK